jgi:Holliday junction resolvase RusA-like endonuclease
MVRSDAATPASARTENGRHFDERLGQQLDIPLTTRVQAQQDTEVVVIIAGPAVAKGRPRTTRRGFVYTPAHTRRYEAHARLAAQLAMGDRRPMTAPVKITAAVDLPIPASWSRSRTAAAITGDIRPTSRPDIDNYIKSALDVLSGIVLADDGLVVEIMAISLVVEIMAIKRFAIDPKVVLTITPLPALASNRRAP